MTVDQYAICPCGNGKKIKFCKCKDSLPELDRIMTMLDGGQIVPALDRINRVLEEHPDAAWALAIKGRILLSLEEISALAENAERFVRLQPTNPLALTQRAASQIFSDRISEATESILEALSESNRQIDPFVIEIISTLAFALANSGRFLSARAFATLAISTEGAESAQTATQVLQALNNDPAVSHLLKALPPHRPRPEHAEWAERFDEALGLLRSNRISLAESKFASLARAYPGEPAILSGLLSCAVWSGNDQAQADCFEKLSHCQQLGLVEQSKMLGMSYLVDTKLAKLSVSLTSWTADLQDVTQTEIALQAHPLFVQIPEQMLRGMVRRENDVPPRAAFQLLDREMPGDDVELTADVIPESIAFVVLYGKQTDRSARIEIPSLASRFAGVTRETLTAAIGEVGLKEEAVNPVPFMIACEPRPGMVNRRMSRVEIDELIDTFHKARIGQRLAEQALPALGNRSLVETSGDESVRLQREAVMRVLENNRPICDEESILEDIRRAAGLEKLPPIVVRNSDEVEEVGNTDLARIDCSGLDAEGLEYLMQRSRLIQVQSALQNVATEVLSREDTPEFVNLKAYAHGLLIQAEQAPVKAIELIGGAKKYFDKVGRDKVQLLLMELAARVRIGDSDGFQNVLRILTTEYRDQEEVMVSVQQILMSLGLINPDGSPRTAGPQPGGPMPGAAPRPVAQSEAASSGLWTPDSGSAAASAGQGGGKLWVPGMD